MENQSNNSGKLNARKDFTNTEFVFKNTNSVFVKSFQVFNFPLLLSFCITDVV